MSGLWKVYDLFIDFYRNRVIFDIEQTNRKVGECYEHSEVYAEIHAGRGGM